MKISYGLRAFAIYFVILGSLIWFTLDNAIERLNDGMRQSAESVLVDLSHLVASFIEDEIAQNLPTDALSNNAAVSLSSDELTRVMTRLRQREFEAKIYQVTKTSVDSQIYVSNADGIIVFDSTGQHMGQDFSRWRDVKLTLQGEYGARTSYIDRRFSEPDDPKVMIVAAPIKLKETTIGVVSIVKPIASLEGHLLTETKQLQRYAFILLALALSLGYVLSLWFTSSLNKIARYANNMADGKQVSPPTLRDARLAELTSAISHLRTQLDGKEYVENYIHSLTHELKTPITSIHGAIELLSEEMPDADRERFLNNIRISNQRMSRLVDRMLSLAKLEGLTQLVAREKFDLVPTISRLLQERSPLIDAHKLQVEFNDQQTFPCEGDRTLIGQAIANLVDNAIAFSAAGGVISIELSHQPERYQVTIVNQGQLIPDFAVSKVFDRFFSLPSSQAKSGASKSTGLGLSFVKEIMKLHRGHVTIENTSSGVRAILHWPSS
ncbi:two-component system sensor histidine kinase CreC [Arenicella xantha]|uniref:histidine kinase n=1 Tax=Arenicella xantha TaxID=644221 RepID=A0A395JJ23_9GAMM|nr:two-component system sensor histidine kinase CreC [Arenicella xantha]RBP48937.1 two-component system sensor histidine kinase CreC [Arenicella xantha]